MRLVPRAEGKGECESEGGVEIEGGLAWRGASLKLKVILRACEALCLKALGPKQGSGEELLCVE